MAPGIQLEPETFYKLKNSSGLYLDETDFEGILGVTVKVKSKVIPLQALLAFGGSGRLRLQNF